jgi:CpeT/CpcT family (DUF1001)
MTHSTDLQTLVAWMAGEFSNQEQAIENPPFFAHIRVCMRPLPLSFFRVPSLYLEQAYDYALDQPYRIRVLKFVVKDDKIEIPHYRIHNEEPFRGAARDLNKLKKLTPDKLNEMCGCGMDVTWTGQSFKGIVEPGKKCLVERNGQMSYLDNEFEVIDEGARLISLDRGRDPQTDERLWGAIAGPFEFTRVRSFSEELQF